MIKIIKLIWHNFNSLHSFAVRQKVAKQAYKKYIGNNMNLSPDKFKEANAFCMGAKYQRSINK